MNITTSYRNFITHMKESWKAAQPFILFLLSMFLVIVVAARIVTTHKQEKANAFEIEEAVQALLLQQQEAEADRALELAQHRADCEALARIILAEANNLSEEGQRCMVDFIWNRVQSTIFTANTIIDVCNQPSQFVNYKEDLPVLQKYYDIAEDELAKIQAETSYRLLPPNMLFYNWTPYEIEFRSSFEITSKTQTWKVS